jgi:foldase protein PrsA
MRAKKVAAILLAVALCASAVTGCGIDKSASAATMGEQTITLGVANFFCRLEQASVEDYYKSMFGGGDDFWSTDLYSDGSTMEDNMKDSAMEELHEMYTLQAHQSDYDVALTDDEKSAITEAAKKFIESNDADTLKEMGADQEIVEEVLTLYTIREKMTTAIQDEADTNVTDEEANMRAYSMVEVATDSYQDDNGDTVEYTDDEKASLKSDVETMVEELTAGEDATLETVAAAHGYEVTTETYASDDSTLDEEVKNALDALKEGETSGVVETDSALYVVRIDKDTDEEATESNRESIIETRKSDHYDEVLEGWQKDDGWKVNDKAVAKISFHNSLTQQDPNASTETESDTEIATEVEGTEE